MGKKSDVTLRSICLSALIIRGGSKMKKNLKLLAMVLCLTLFGTMALGCGSSGSGGDKEIASVTNPDSEKETDQETNSAVTIEEQVLFEGNDFKITATGIEDGLFGTDLKLLIENNGNPLHHAGYDACNVDGDEKRF